MPTVSVVIPCYNYSRYLGEAIQSALSQTLPPKEVIVVDDGSTDDTEEVARAFPVRLIAQDHLGVCSALNRGVQASRCEFLLRLDADDLLRPEFLERTVPVLQNQPELGFVYTQFELFGMEAWVHPSREYALSTLMKENYISCSALVRRSAFKQVGGYDEKMLAGWEDWDLYLSLAEAGWRGQLVAEPLLRYRRHSLNSRDSLSHQYRRALRGQLRRNHPSLYTGSYRLRDFVQRALHIAKHKSLGWGRRLGRKIRWQSSRH